MCQLTHHELKCYRKSILALTIRTTRTPRSSEETNEGRDTESISEVDKKGEDRLDPERTSTEILLPQATTVGSIESREHAEEYDGAFRRARLIVN